MAGIAVYVIYGITCCNSSVLSTIPAKRFSVELIRSKPSPYRMAGGIKSLGLPLLSLPYLRSLFGLARVMDLR